MIRAILPLGCFFLCQPGQAQGLRPPEPPQPVAGECPESVPIRSGDAFPASVAGPDGRALCEAVLVPVSELAYLLQVEEYSDAVGRLHVLDIQLLETERDWYRDQYVTSTAPEPWYNTPVAHRWVGRAEALIAVTLVTFGMGYMYDASGVSR